MSNGEMNNLPLREKVVYIRLDPVFGRFLRMETNPKNNKELIIVLGRDTEHKYSGRFERLYRGKQIAIYVESRVDRDISEKIEELNPDGPLKDAREKAILDKSQRTLV